MEIKDCAILEKMAFERGCTDVKIIHTDQIIVENRVRLKCMFGCPNYGKTLKCPPYTPSIEEFRRILKEYDRAMIVKFKPYEVSEELMKKLYTPSNNGKARLWNQDEDTEVSQVLWSKFSSHYKNRLTDLLELERAAFNQGYTFAMAFFAGRCLLCEECNVEDGVCLNPVIARSSAEAMGINLLKTAENVGINIKFSNEDNQIQISPMGILLID